MKFKVETVTYYHQVTEWDVEAESKEIALDIVETACFNGDPEPSYTSEMFLDDEEVLDIKEVGND